MSAYSLKYRPDIDGLRAIAVSSVVAFHAFPLQIPGGFSGVDVFFVISGYLISRIILGSIEAETFSIIEFYRRRIRRLFPALLVVLFVAVALGWAFLLPDELQDLGRGAASGAGFFANFQMWKESGYFDLNSSRRPLLHLWSLGVEEQFYFIWPVLLFLLSRFWKNRLVPALAFLALASFLHGVWESPIHPSYSFYLPLTRFWELMVGGILATRASSSFRPTINNCLSVIGAISLVAGFSLIDTAKAFPGTWALLPVVGASLLIAAGPSAWLNRSILGRKPVVLVGLASYPLYLWHWPILVYARTVINPSTLQLFGLITLSVGLAFATWWFLERPIRLRAERDGGARDVFVLAAAMGVVFVAGAAIRYSTGFPLRMPHSSAVAIADVTEGAAGFEYTEGPVELSRLDVHHQARPGRPEAAVYGDSHAAYLYHGLISADPSRNWLGMASIDCSLFLDDGKRQKGRDCSEQFRSAMQYLSSSEGPQTVVIAHYGYSAESVLYGADRLGAQAGLTAIVPVSSTDPVKAHALQKGLESAIRKIQAAGKSVYYVIDVPEMPVFARDCLQRVSIFRPKSTCSVTQDEVELRQRGIREIAAKLKAANPELTIVDSVPALCRNGFPCELASSSFSFYEDSQHVSVRGATEVAKELLGHISQQHDRTSFALR